jgi:hypothetical protein
MPAAIDAPRFLAKIHCSEIVMRPKFVITFLLLAVAVFGAIILLKPKPAAPPAPPFAETTTTAPPETARPPAKKLPPVENAAPVKSVEEAVAAVPETAPANNPPPAPAATATNEVLTVLERTAAIDRLQDWSTHDAKDTDALTNIVAALSSPDEKVREAAIDATRELGSKDAIPALTEAAAHTSDPDEKKALLDAIKFLKLPLLGTPEAMQDPPADNDKPEPPATEPTKP